MRSVRALLAPRRHCAAPRLPLPAASPPLLRGRRQHAAPLSGSAEPPTVPLIQLADAPPEVRAVYEDIMESRDIPDVNNFWKAIAHHPPTLRRTWSTLKEVMAPGALDSLTKEMLYVAISSSKAAATASDAPPARCPPSHSPG